MFTAKRKVTVRNRCTIDWIYKKIACDGSYLIELNVQFLLCFNNIMIQSLTDPSGYKFLR